MNSSIFLKLWLSELFPARKEPKQHIRMTKFNIKLKLCNRKKTDWDISHHVSCGTIDGIRFCGCRWVQVRVLFCLFWRETHTKGLHARFSTRPEKDKGKQSPKAVDRRKQSIGENNQQKSGEEATAKRGAGTCGLRGRVGQRERRSQRSLRQRRNFVRIHTHDFLQVHRKLHKVSQTSPF